MNIFRIKLFFSVVFVILLTFFMSGCDAPCRIAPLVNAERIIEERPDSALVILTKLNDSILNTPGDKALYALLLTQANVKTYTANASDSLINIAVDYYSGRRDKERYMKSLFYQAQVRYDIGQYDMAIVPASTARDLAIEFGDPYWRAKAAELMADIFAKYYMRQETIDYRKEAVIQYGLAGKELNQRYSLVDLAISYYNKAKDLCKIDSLPNHPEIRESFHILDSLYMEVATSADTTLLINILRTQITENVNVGNYDKASSLKDSLSLISTKPTYATSVLFCDYALLHIHNGDFIEAARLLERANDQASSVLERSHVLSAKVDLCKIQGNYHDLSKYLEQIIELQDIEMHNSFQSSIITKLKDDATYKVVKERDYSRRLTFIFVLVTVSICCIAIVVVLFFRVRFKLNRIKAEQVEEEIISLKEDVSYLQDVIDATKQEKNNLLASISEKDTQIAEIKDNIVKLGEEKSDNEENSIYDLQKKLDEAIESKRRMSERAAELESLLVSQIKNNEAKNSDLEILFIQRWEVIGNMCNDFISKNGATEFDKNLPKTLKEEIDKLNRPKERKQLVSLVNYYMGNIIALLREEVESDMSEEDEFLYALIFLKFSPKTISILAKINFKTVHTRKRRLKEKINSVNPLNKTLFLSKLE